MFIINFPITKHVPITETNKCKRNKLYLISYVNLFIKRKHDLQDQQML